MTEIHIPDHILYPKSLIREGKTTYFLAKYLVLGEKVLGVRGDKSGFTEVGRYGNIILCPLEPLNAAELRRRLPWLNPVPLGLRTSFGFGDRMGLATPGHVQALRAADPQGKIAPIFAQQSVRENTRTGRSPQQVMDDAMWGVFQEGWREPWGADADHVKAVGDLQPFLDAGYTFFTVDPSDHVDNQAQDDNPATLREKQAALPWESLQTSYADLRARYLSVPIRLDGLNLEFTEEILLRALAKYGRALAHVIAFAQELKDHFGSRPFDLEMSVDETDTPTSVYEHFFIANELARTQVPVDSLAPRFAGKFQKGVDYIGDLTSFERDLIAHNAVLRHFGSYKLSIHTGSDKFSLYPIIAGHTGGRLHVKTAGTSYLEALRAIAEIEPALFRAILDLARRRFEIDRHSYFLDCDPNKVPASGQLADADLPGLLEDFDARQMLHVTFGSALDELGEQIKAQISAKEEAYQARLVRHFNRHLVPLL